MPLRLVVQVCHVPAGCMVFALPLSTPPGEAAVCGNGVLAAGEQCDYGNRRACARSLEEATVFSPGREPWDHSIASALSPEGAAEQHPAATVAPLGLGIRNRQGPRAHALG